MHGARATNATSHLRSLLHGARRRPSSGARRRSHRCPCVRLGSLRGDGPAPALSTPPKPPIPDPKRPVARNRTYSMSARPNPRDIATAQDFSRILDTRFHYELVRRGHCHLCSATCSHGFLGCRSPLLAPGTAARPPATAISSHEARSCIDPRARGKHACVPCTSDAAPRQQRRA